MCRLSFYVTRDVLEALGKTASWPWVYAPSFRSWKLLKKPDGVEYGFCSGNDVARSNSGHLRLVCILACSSLRESPKGQGV